VSSSTNDPHAVARPVVATLAAVVRENRILLIRRSNPPDAGRWAFPGGKIRFGESAADAAQRELLEETGVQGKPVQVFDAVNVFDQRADEGDVLHQHYILIATLFDWHVGEPRGGDDALDARWFADADLDSTELAQSFDIAAVARRAFRLALSLRTGVDS